MLRGELDMVIELLDLSLIVRNMPVLSGLLVRAVIQPPELVTAAAGGGLCSGACGLCGTVRGVEGAVPGCGSALCVDSNVFPCDAMPGNDAIELFPDCVC